MWIIKIITITIRQCLASSPISSNFVDNPLSIERPGIGGILLFMFFEGILYFTLVLLIQVHIITLYFVQWLTFKFVLWLCCRINSSFLNWRFYYERVMVKITHHQFPSLWDRYMYVLKLECVYNYVGGWMCVCVCGGSFVQLLRSWAPNPRVGGSIPTWTLLLCLWASRFIPIAPASIYTYLAI